MNEGKGHSKGNASSGLVEKWAKSGGLDSVVKRERLEVGG